MKTAEEIKRYIKHYEHRFQEAQEQIKEDPEDWNPYLERSNAAIRRFVAVMVTSYIVIAMIGAIGAWLFLAVPKSAQLNDARQQIDKLEDQLDVLEEGNRVLAEEVEVKETLIENLQWELENR